jgi:hypothetical protein
VPWESNARGKGKVGRFFFRRIRHEVSITPLRAPLVWYRHHHIAKNDVILTEYPKSGNTWLKFLLYELFTGQPAGFEIVGQFFNNYAKVPRVLPDRGRVIATHEPYRGELKRAIYLSRDPRDVVLSEYAYMKGLGLFTKDLDAFIRTFLRGRVNGYGSWQAHVDGWLDAADAGKVKLFLVRYEEMRKNPEAALAAVAGFCGFRVDPAAIHLAVEGNSIERMREKEDAARQWASAHGVKGPLRPMVGSPQDGNRFVREGKVGGWRERLTAAQIELIESHAGSALTRLGYGLASSTYEALSTVPASRP